MRALALAVLLSTAACAGAPPSPATSAGPGGARSAEAGQLYRSRCSGCHRPYEPSSRTQAQWRTVLSRMAPKAHLSAPEEDRLRAFLLAGASDADAPGR